MSTDYDFSGRTLSQRYVLSHKIGAGAFATVYVAHDLRMFKRRVAIKVLNPERHLNPQNVDRFIQEVKVAAKLDGPYRDRVVKIIDQDRCEVGDPPLLYLVMEHVDGITLQSLLRPAGPQQPRQPLPWTQAVAIVRELLKALGTLHDCGVVHRDIKPGNCILEQRPDGDFLKLLDLGIVKVLPGYEMSGDHPRTQPEFVLGTPRYMAPEQFGGPVTDPRVDLYSAGVMLYEFLTGDVPARWYEQPGAAHPYELLPPSRVNPLGAIPRALDALVLRAIAFEPHRRFQTAPEFARALAELLHTDAAQARPRPPSAQSTAVVVRVVPSPVVAQAADEETDRLGPWLRWWTVVSTTATAMVFVFAFASLLRRAESRPTLELESDDVAPAAEAPRGRTAATRPFVANPAATRTADASAATRTAAAGGALPEPAPKPADGSSGSTKSEPPSGSTKSEPGSEPPSGSTSEPPSPKSPGKQPSDPPAKPAGKSAKPADAKPRDTASPRKPKPQSEDVEDPGELMPVRPTTVKAVEASAQRELQRACGGAPRRSYTVHVRVDPGTGKVLGVDVRGDGVASALRSCVAGRASKAFQFAGLRAREASYVFTMSL